MALDLRRRFALWNASLLVFAAVSGLEHGLRLWHHFNAARSLGRALLVFEAAGTALMAGVVVICAARLWRLLRSREERG